MPQSKTNLFKLEFPFGGYNTIVESFYMGLPCLTIVGDRFYNRAASYLNEQVGMEDNSFDSPRDMINRAADMIVNPDLLKEQRNKLAAVDLKERLFTLKGNHFLEAIQYIEANHPFTETKIIGDNNDEA